MMQNIINIGGRAVDLGTVIPALITPMHQGRIDFASLDGLLRHVLVSGICSVVVLGNTGEFQKLSLLEAKQFISGIADSAGKNGFTPIVNVTRQKSVDEAVELSNYASSRGLFVQMVAPMYFWNGNPHVPMRKIISDSHDNARFFIYENEALYTTGTPGLDHVFTGLYSDGHHPKVVAVKYSTMNEREYDLIAQQRSEHFMVFIGNDLLINSVNACKANGLISGTACYVPRDVVFYWKRPDKATAIQEFGTKLDTVGERNYIAGLKTMLRNKEIIKSDELVR